MRELRRSVQELGFVGAMLHGRTGERYLDHLDFRPLLAEAAALGVPPVPAPADAAPSRAGGILRGLW